MKPETAFAAIVFLIWITCMLIIVANYWLSKEIKDILDKIDELEKRLR